jgi:hypothetical protein
VSTSLKTLWTIPPPQTVSSISLAGVHVLRDMIVSIPGFAKSSRTLQEPTRYNRTISGKNAVAVLEQSRREWTDFVSIGSTGKCGVGRLMW